MPIQPGIELTKIAILERLTEEKIMERYIGLEVDTESFFQNPLRPDQRPGCRFYYNSKGRLYFHDWGKFHWDCFAVVQYRYGDSFIQALRRISHDFSLKDIEAQYFQEYVPIIKVREEVKVCVRNWEKDDLKFWNKGGVDTNTLKWGNTFALKAFWINNEYYKCWKNDPTYCYYFGNGLYKLYFPARKEMRFWQNINQVDDDLTQFWDQLPPTGEILILTKSKKDGLSMYTFDITADAVLSETHLIKPEKMAQYKARFKYIFTLFDHDQAGRYLALKYWKVYGIPYLMFPKGWRKDFFANVELFGRVGMIKIIHEWKLKQNLI